jgi:hypothetical protein
VLLVFAPTLVACSGKASITIPDEPADTGPGSDALAEVGDDATPPPDAAPEAAPPPAGTISASSTSAVESETHIAARPDGSLVAAWIAIASNGNSDIGYAFSNAGGATWAGPQVVKAPDGRSSSDPVLATNAAGDVFLTWLGLRFDAKGNASDMVLYVSVAKAGGATFSTPVAVTTDATTQYDKPWITVLPDGAVVVTYANTSTGGLYAARSTDGGAHWTIAKIIEDGSFRNLAFPCYDAKSKRLFVTYHAGGGIGLRFSDDGGQGWDAKGTAVADTGEQPAFDDPTCVADAGEVWVSYGLTQDSGNAEATSPKLNAIQVAHSGDGGATIDRRGNALEGAKYGMHPYLVREATGALDLADYAGDADADPMGSLRYRRSSDGAAHWNPSAVLYAPVLFTGDRSSGQWLGDYFGVVATAGALHASYVVNLPKYAHVAHARATLP